MSESEHGDDSADEHLEDQGEIAEDSRTSGGDASAAGTMREREDVAADDDELFGSD